MLCVRRVGIAEGAASITVFFLPVKQPAIHLTSSFVLKHTTQLIRYTSGVHVTIDVYATGWTSG